jgi:hypothetical protein
MNSAGPAATPAGQTVAKLVWVAVGNPAGILIPEKSGGKSAGDADRQWMVIVVKALAMKARASPGEQPSAGPAAGGSRTAR